MFSFDDWWRKYLYKYDIRSYVPIGTEDVEAAYIAGFNACRDKWGGLTYEQTMGDEE